MNDILHRDLHDVTWMIAPDYFHIQRRDGFPIVTVVFHGQLSVAVVLTTDEARGLAKGVGEEMGVEAQ